MTLVPPRVAYLVSEYPAISHAFIEREVLALRDLGVQVDTFSIRPSPARALLSETARAEAERTTPLLGQPLPEYPRAALRLLRSHPRAVWRGLRAAWVNGPRTLRSRVWQHFYLAEAILMLDRLRASGTRHVHVHFANNSADVARLVVTMGEAVDGPTAGWRWTLSMHGPTEFTDPAGHDLPAKVRSADAIACISDYCRDQLKALVDSEHWDKMSIVRMGVVADRFPAAAEDRARRSGGPLRVLFVGRLVPEKGPNVLVEAVQRLSAAGRDVEAVIIGAGPLQEQLDEQVLAAGLSERVRLLGPVGQDALPQWYAWADVFCLPSYAEGVPVVLMEAMSTELPVVTTRIAGIPELVESGRSGFLVGPGHPEEIAGAIGHLADDAELRSQMGVSARRRVVEEFQPGFNARRLREEFTGSMRGTVVG